MSSAPEFGFDTKGSEVVAAFPDKVRGKTCMFHPQTPSETKLTIIVLITGPSQKSLGALTAQALAEEFPGTFLLLGRSLSKIQPVIDSIIKISPSTKVHFIQLNLSSLPSVRKAAAEVKTVLGDSRIDVFLNNAGIMALHDFQKNDAGVEMQFAVNHLGPFLLTGLLAPLVVDGGRIVNVSSAGHALGEVRFDDLNFGDGKEYDEWEAYAQGVSSPSSIRVHS